MIEALGVLAMFAGVAFVIYRLGKSASELEARKGHDNAKQHAKEVRGDMASLADDDLNDWLRAPTGSSDGDNGL